MDTLAMVMTVVGTGFCWVPGWGWMGVFLAVAGISIGIWGMTDTRTKPGDLGMDVASWVYGVIGLSVGLSFQAKYMEGGLDFLLAPIPMGAAAIIAAAILPIFIWVQIAARKRARRTGVGVAFFLYLLLTEMAFTAITLADRAGMSLVAI